MTYKQGVEMIESIFAATIKGRERAALIKCVNKIDAMMEAGEISFRMGDRLKNYAFDYKAMIA